MLAAVVEIFCVQRLLIESLSGAGFNGIMNLHPYMLGFVGGLLIGLAASLLLVFSGKIAGVSGILYRSFLRIKGDFAWRISFLCGLILGGGVLFRIHEESFDWKPAETSLPLLVVAGLLVGYGSVLGNGCTSGHGVCGLSRFSMRSFIATITFIALGILSVRLIHEWGF